MPKAEIHGLLVVDGMALSCRITVMNCSASQEHDMYTPPIQQ